MSVRRRQRAAGRAGAFAIAAISAALLAACSPSAAPAAHQLPATPIHPATAGSITGVVRWAGVPPAMPMLDMSGTPGCQPAGAPPVHGQAVVVNPNGTLRWAFVYIASGLEAYHFDPPLHPAQLVQQGCQFRPHVLGLMPGQPLEVSSRDPIPHNVFADPQHNRRWNLSMLPGSAPILERFAHPEIMIPVECNVHSWMHAYIGVVGNPYFAVTGTDGAFTLRHLPPGHYTLAVWQQRYGIERQEVDLLPRQQVRVVFTYSGTGK